MAAQLHKKKRHIVAPRADAKVGGSGFRCLTVFKDAGCRVKPGMTGQPYFFVSHYKTGAAIKPLRLRKALACNISVSTHAPSRGATKISDASNYGLTPSALTEIKTAGRGFRLRRLFFEKAARPRDGRPGGWCAVSYRVSS